ncbi:hypothetical protein pb186bvf_002007 [Paramecium bursaria]
MSWIQDFSIKPANNLRRIFAQERESIQEVQVPAHLIKKQGKKPSQILYDTLYREIHELFKYRSKEPDLTLADQNFNCYQCQKKISNGFLSIGANCDLCYYTGRYYCSGCLSSRRMPIPWKALQEFDLRHYKVSKIGEMEIERYYKHPIIEIEERSKLVQHNKSLFEFLVMKRQLHLMYDTICDPKLMQGLLENRMNLCLKQNLFSLKDLYEIYNGSLYKILMGYYAILIKHVDFCKSCSKRGQICQICQNIIPVHAFDIQNGTYCEKCLNLYHRKCLELGNCPHCLAQN